MKNKLSKLFKGNKSQASKADEPAPIYIMVLVFDPRDNLLRPGTAGNPIPIDIAHGMLDKMREYLVRAQVQGATPPTPAADQAPSPTLDQKSP